MSSDSKRNIATTLSILGLLLTIGGFLEIGRLVQSQIWRQNPNYILLGIGVTVILIAVILYKGSPPAKPKKLPNFRGEWEYHVETADGTRVHWGHCTVKQEGEELRISGTRTHSLNQKEGNQAIEKKVNIHWTSIWCELCADGKVRFDYGIDLHEGHTVGYCILDYPDSKLEKMSGSYYQLPTQHGKTDFVYGTISFFRLRDITGNPKKIEGSQIQKN
ncbi:MAG TPA: hypothetical protein VLB76_19600 [Thermoanaerobaculia bacterium]|jgi:hypothetical protein|nr:hypothetical protein [Thermoanaerobaculia bacterium]